MVRTELENPETSTMSNDMPAHRGQPIRRRRVLQSIGGAAAGSVAVSGSGAANRGGLQRELAAVRSATAAYNNPDNAVADGYMSEEEAVCGMGYHYPNPGLLDFTVDKVEPEAMVYGETHDGTRILGAVEYIAPKAGPYAESPPASPFDNADPEWGVLHLPPEAPVPFNELWTLHAWVHTHNPRGVFHPTNPRKQFSPEGCVPHSH
jgi:hypothetical protein